MDRQTDRHTDRQTNRWTDRQTNRQTDGETGGLTETDRQTGGQTDRQAGGQTDRQTNMWTDRQTDTIVYNQYSILTVRYINILTCDIVGKAIAITDNSLPHLHGKHPHTRTLNRHINVTLPSCRSHTTSLSYQSPAGTSTAKDAGCSLLYATITGG